MVHSLFSIHIFSFEILTFIEIEIGITTGGHQLKYDFYFSLFITSDFFTFSALVLAQKTWNVGCLSEILPRTPLIMLHTTSGILLRTAISCGLFA